MRFRASEENEMQTQESKEKKAYEKPEAKRFPLRPEEAVLGFCKTNASSGPAPNGCRGGFACQTAGS
jgi:spore cortex formation protein SpoVR/YcgB (stage V sporulation)